MANVHKRSSSDAGVSYHVRPNRDRRAMKERRARDKGFQIIDQQGVSISDGRRKNIQSVLVCVEHFEFNEKTGFKQGRRDRWGGGKIIDSFPI